MIHNMISSGAALNFKIVGSPTEPETPKENTIWVETDAEITAWALAPAAPDSPTEGMVWIQTDVDSTASFNALKKQAITLCPASCSQYIDGAWAAKTAQLYQDGAWKSWRTYLYNAGDECVLLTGGWEDAMNAGYKNSITRYDAYMKLTSKYADYYGAANSVNKVNLANYRNLCIECYKTGNDTCYFGLSSSTTSDTLTASVQVLNTSYATLRLDISKYTGSYYIRVMSMAGANGSTYVKNIWLE